MPRLGLLLPEELVRGMSSRCVAGRDWGPSSCEPDISFMSLALLCVRNRALVRFIAKQREGPGSRRPLQWHVFLLEMSRGVICASCAHKGESLLFGKDAALPHHLPLRRKSWGFFGCCYQQKCKALPALRAAGGRGRGRSPLLAGGSVPLAVWNRFNT